MDNTYVMELVIGNYSPAINRLGFSTYEKAKEQLDLISPKVGIKFKNDPDWTKHTIISDDGELVVAVEQVQSVRIIDWNKFLKLMEFQTQNKILKEAPQLAGLDSNVKNVESKSE